MEQWGTIKNVGNLFSLLSFLLSNLLTDLHIRSFTSGMYLTWTIWESFSNSRSSIRTLRIIFFAFQFHDETFYGGSWCATFHRPKFVLSKPSFRKFGHSKVEKSHLKQRFDIADQKFWVLDLEDDADHFSAYCFLQKYYKYIRSQCFRRRENLISNNLL